MDAALTGHLIPLLKRHQMARWKARRKLRAARQTDSPPCRDGAELWQPHLVSGTSPDLRGSFPPPFSKSLASSQYGKWHYDGFGGRAEDCQIDMENGPKTGPSSFQHSTVPTRTEAREREIEVQVLRTWHGMASASHKNCTYPNVDGIVDCYLTRPMWIGKTSLSCSRNAPFAMGPTLLLCCASRVVGSRTARGFCCSGDRLARKWLGPRSHGPINIEEATSKY